MRSSLSEYRTILSSVLSTGTEYSGVQVVVRYMLPVLAVPQLAEYRYAALEREYPQSTIEEP